MVATMGVIFHTDITVLVGLLVMFLGSKLHCCFANVVSFGWHHFVCNDRLRYYWLWSSTLLQLCYLGIFLS